MAAALAVAIVVAATACATHVPSTRVAWPADDHHGAWAASFPDADTVRVTPLVRGVRHVYLWLPAGPWAVHLVELDQGLCAPDLAAVKAGPPLSDLAPTTALGADALVAINGDFFMRPGGTPVGAHVHEGRVMAGPGTRPAYMWDVTGDHRAGTARIVGFAIAGEDSASITQVNRPIQGNRHHPPPAGLVAFDRWYGDSIPAEPGVPTMGLRVVEREAAGGAGRGVVDVIAGERRSVALNGRRMALRATDEASTQWLGGVSPGDTIRWWVRLLPADGGHPVAEAVGGFPVLVEGGRGVVAEQQGVIPTFGEARHPRTAVGWDDDARSYWIVVDGRQAPYSDGMSLRELEWLLLRLGATEAINLDGGGSTAMAIRGELANRPSDPAGERAVANVLALRGCL